jgi:hypothetical protein
MVMESPLRRCGRLRFSRIKLLHRPILAHAVDPLQLAESLQERDGKSLAKTEVPRSKG